MSFSWKQYEGQVINNTFPLQQYLGGSSNSAVFLTQLAGPQSSKAAIKLIPDDASADLQLSLWRRASKLTHPNLLPLYQGGRCRLADMDLLYVVMEYAEEDLAQILPQRALTPSEARDMLGPLLDALIDLQAQGLVHSHLKPSNVLATSDQVKLSTDTLFPIGELRRSSGKLTVYDAPESASQPISPACDVWSLGVMLIEVLTQRAPDSQPERQSLPFVPHTLPQPFLDIARNALLRDPKARWTMSQIATSLNPRAAAAAAQSISPLSVPLSPIAPLPAAPLPAVTIPAAPAPVAPAPVARMQAPIPAPKPRPVPVQPVAKAPSRRPPAPDFRAQQQEEKALVVPSYVVPIVVAAIVIGALLALPKILGKRAEVASSPSISRATQTAASAPTERPGKADAARNAKPAPPPPTRESSKTTAAEKPPTKEVSTAPPVSSSPAALRTETKPAADAPAASSAGAGRGEVLDQVLPDASDRALATIRGTVRVTVRAHVDPAGNVSSAEFDNPGPSPFFADLALKAARRWEFTSSEADGRSVPSEWLIRFEFSPSGVKAFPKQTAP